MSQELALKLEPNWCTIKDIWDVSVDFFGREGLGPDAAYALSMVTQELLENAVKYGRFSSSDKIDLGMRIGEGDVTIEVKSPVSPDDDQLRHLDDTIQWIRGFQDPFEAYVDRLKLLSTQPQREGGSGLGLVRIAYEGQAILDFYVDESGVLAISAVHRR
ncbi:MAG: ATP-binding protein [Myxococcota bacterium]